MDQKHAGEVRRSAAPPGGEIRTVAAATALSKAIAADIAAAASRLRRRAPDAWASMRQGAAAAGRWGGKAAHWGRRGTAATRSALRPFGVVRTFVFLALVGVAALAAILAWALYDLPYASVLEEGEHPAILLETADGALLARKGPVREADVSREELPDHLVDAVLSIEDRRFYTHRGVDPRGILRAARSNFDAGGVVQGGSTITQQLVKIRYLDQEQTLKRKIREAALAVWLDAQLGKDEILTRYFNNVYFGAGATGIAAAARIYFGKEVSELTLAESALLAGLIKAPSQYNPLHDLEAARGRTTVVLDAMVANRKIDADTAEAVKAEPAELNPARIAAHSGTWFADWVHAEAAEIAGSYRGAMRVRTTFDPALQAIAERVVARALEDGGTSGAGQAALVAMRPDGAVLAMVGGRSYEDSEFNRAVQAKRQPGSAFKLFVYYAALRNGMALDDAVEDAPIEIDGWEPENFSEQFFGRVTLAEAFARSLNAATVRLAQEVGIAEVVAAARDLGIEAPLQETPSLALGSSEVTLLDMTEAYAAVRAGVAPIKAWGIAGFGGADQPQLFGMGPPLEERRTLGEHHEPLVRLLQGVVEGGTGQRAALEDGFAAGKTGTSQNYRDAWFIGFSEPLVVGVWVGNDDATPMDEVTGGRLPAEIWRQFMSEALEAARSGRVVAAGAAAQAEAAGEAGEDAAPVAEGDTIAPGESAEEVTAAEADEMPAASAAQALAPTAERDRIAPGELEEEVAATDADEVPAASRMQEAAATIDGDEGGGGSLFAEARAMSEAVEPEAPQCNVRVCARFYRSFRASDCTFQPYGGGPRRLCER